MVSSPNTSMLPDFGLVEADDGAQQHRFARARSADHAHHLARHHIQIEMIVDQIAAKLVDEAAHADDRFAHIPITEKKIENARIEHDDEENGFHHRARGELADAWPRSSPRAGLRNSRQAR